MQSPPELEVPLELIEKDQNAKDVEWDDRDNSLDIF